MGKQDDDDRSGMKRIDLDDDEWKKRAEKLASEESERFALIDKKRTHNRAWDEQLIQLRDSIKQLTEEVETRTAWVPAQTDMFGESANDAASAEEEPEPDVTPAGRRRRRRGRGAEPAGAGFDAA